MSATKPRILFILKRREDYGDDPSYSSSKSVSTGMWNSARFVSDMLVKHGIDSQLVQVIDNNCIDREVTAYKPTHVIVEALWVVPSKFEILTKLHPTVTWYVRVHSEIPFVAGEGIAMRWIHDYIGYKNVNVTCNAKRVFEEVTFLIKHSYGFTDKEVAARVSYLPNFYEPTVKYSKPVSKIGNELHVGCFGAIRPLKNQLEQAVAALKFADRMGKKLHFHINTGRVEMKGSPVLHNIIALFDTMADQGHVLHQHQWVSHDQFIELVKTMHIGMQVSFTETFNIVTADFVANNIPVVVSPEINWVSSAAIADPTLSNDMVCKMSLVWRFRCLFTWLNRRGLKRYSDTSAKLWIKHFTKSC